MTDIDWRKQPPGFPLWLEGTNDDHRAHSGWYRDAGQVFEGADGGQWRAVREGQFFTVHRKPEAPVWDGKDLPPVGTVCEVVWPGYNDVRFDRFIGKDVTVVAHDVIDGSAVAVFRMPVGGQSDEMDYHAMVAKCFKPSRTPDQIAAEDLYQIINQEGTVADQVTAILKAGYRKQVAP